MNIKGIGASSGVSIAKVFELKEAHVEISDKKINDIAKEIEKINSAVDKVVKQIGIVKEKALKNLGAEEAAVFDAHIQVASDPTIIDEAKKINRIRKV